ncbi:MAG: diacylglycerol kinase family protein [Crocinitomicaceae bacterium]
MKQRIQFIINPISGVHKKTDIPGLIETHLDHDKYEYAISYTEYRKHAIKIAKKCSKEGIDIVCAVGGDGSVHEVGTALIGKKTRMAIIPVGSGNGLARHLNIPLNVKDAILCINEGKNIKMDTVKVNNRAFIGIGGYGFDAVVAKEFDKGKKRGLFGYILTVLKEFFKYNPLNVSIDIDGKVKSLPVMLCTVANSSQFGNGFTVSPDSDVEDGELELFILKPFSIWNAPQIAYNFFRKKRQKKKFGEIIPFKKARIKLSKKIAHYDGEPIEVTDELSVSVVPKSLHVLVGNKK